MAKVTTKTTAKTYVLELTEREANALTEAVLATNFSEGEGDVLDDIYTELVGAGAETGLVNHRIENGEVIIERDE